MKIKIGIATPAYKRYNLLEKYCIYINEIKNFAKKDNIEIIPILISDDKKIKKISIKNKIECLGSENIPLSTKWNNGISYFEDKNVDAVLILGSDNFVSYEIIKIYKEAILDENIDILGFKDIYYWNDNRGYYFGGYTNNRRGEPIGAGRLLKKSALKVMSWKPWDVRKSKGLDRALNNRIKKLGLNQHVLELGQKEGWILDVKGFDVSITRFKNIKRVAEPYNDPFFKKWVNRIIG